MPDILQAGKLAVWKKIRLRDVGFGAGFALALAVSIGAVPEDSCQAKLEYAR